MQSRELISKLVQVKFCFKIPKINFYFKDSLEIVRFFQFVDVKRSKPSWRRPRENLRS